MHFTPTTALASHGAAVVERYGVNGAREMALGGYQDLFGAWLPFYRSVKADAYGLQKTLLKIMSTLDDTCVIHRVGHARAQEVKAEAGALLKGEIAGQAGNDGKGQAGNDGKGHAGNDGGGQGTDWPERLRDLCARYAAERISPGGAADMLALTIYMESILH